MSRAAEFHDPARTNKASLVFTLRHTQGSLSKVLTVLSFYDINLTKIQSLPIIGREWEYQFLRRRHLRRPRAIPAGRRCRPPAHQRLPRPGRICRMSQSGDLKPETSAIQSIKVEQSKITTIMNDLQPIVLPGVDPRRPLVIAGPCSAETEEQVIQTARTLASEGIRIYRAGLWKPPHQTRRLRGRR